MVRVQDGESFSHVKFDVDHLTPKGLMLPRNSWIYRSKGMSRNRAGDGDSESPAYSRHVRLWAWMRPPGQMALHQ